jgi:DNA-binding transcriptional LysR family regulator
MNLNNIEIFVQVAEKGTFTDAARALSLSPSVVSRRIQDLEQSLGATLFARSTRQMSLTEAGEAFYERCTRAISDLNDAESVVNNLYGKPSGTLRVSAVWAFAETVVLPLIPEFLRRYPDVRVKLTMNVVPVNLVEAGMDVVIRSGTVADEAGYAHCDLAAVQHLICGSPDYFAQFGTPSHPRDLAQFNCLTHDFYASKEWWFKDADHDISVRVQGSFQANNSEALRVAAVSGIGIVRLPTYVAAKDIAAGKLQVIFREYTVPHEKMRAFYARSEYVPSKIPVFLEFLKTEIAERALCEPLPLGEGAATPPTKSILATADAGGRASSKTR